MAGSMAQGGEQKGPAMIPLLSACFTELRAKGEDGAKHAEFHFSALQLWAKSLAGGWWGLGTVVRNLERGYVVWFCVSVSCRVELPVACGDAFPSFTAQAGKRSWCRREKSSTFHPRRVR